LSVTVIRSIDPSNSIRDISIHCLSCTPRTYLSQPHVMPGLDITLYFLIRIFSLILLFLRSRDRINPFKPKLV
jgi:hypothetical protein